MKFRSFGWGVVCIIAISLLTFSGQVKQADKPQVQKEVITPDFTNKVKLSPGIDKGWPALVKLGIKIKEDIDFLENSFKDLKFDPNHIVARLDQRRSVISREHYALIYGKDSDKFWIQQHAEGTILKIELAMVYVSNVTGPHLIPKEVVEPPIGGGTFDAVAFAIVEFHFIKKTKEGAVLHNATFSGELGYRHQDNCQWGN